MDMPVKKAPEPSPAEKPLTETKAELYAAQEKLTNIINSAIHNEVVDHQDLEDLTKIAASIAHGINYLEHVEMVLKKLQSMNTG